MTKPTCHITPCTITDRGYTGHEHMDAFNLINMNGRAYDPLVGQFLSPDPFVPNPENTQSYNRYAYCLNNPLKYTDPSGYYFQSFYESNLWWARWEYQNYINYGQYEQTEYTRQQEQAIGKLMVHRDWEAKQDLWKQSGGGLLNRGSISGNVPMFERNSNPPDWPPDGALDDYGNPKNNVFGGEIIAPAPYWYRHPSRKYTDNIGAEGLTSIMLLNFISGIGPKELVYGPNSPSSKMLAKSEGVQWAINAFKNNESDFYYNYSPGSSTESWIRSINSHLHALINNNIVQLQTGSWRAVEMRQIENSSLLFMKIENQMSLSSATYRISKKIGISDSNTGWTIDNPGTTINQTFYLIVPLY